MARELNKPIVVAKFGGTSLSDIDRIRASANQIIRLRNDGYHVVVVVSAMGGETNNLLKLGLEIGPAKDESRRREFDALLSTGEQVSASLMAMAIQEMGFSASSFNSSQVKVHAESKFQKARIKSIDSKEILATLRRKSIAVVTGFQGIDRNANVVTLGRGGSDTTAVALAVALEADKCEIYTDVEGIFTADPRILPYSKKLDTINFEEMIELSSSGSEVLHLRSVELAMKNNLKLHVRSSFSNTEGTLVIGESSNIEDLVVTGIAHDDHQAKLTVAGIENRPDTLAKVLEPLAIADISIDLISQNIGIDNRMTISFTLDESDLIQAKECLISKVTLLDLPEIHIEKELVKISVVGIGMRTRAGVAQKVFALLTSKQIPILMGLSTEIKVSCIIPSKHRDTAVLTLHDGFNL